MTDDWYTLHCGAGPRSVERIYNGSSWPAFRRALVAALEGGSKEITGSAPARRRDQIERLTARPLTMYYTSSDRE